MVGAILENTLTTKRRILPRGVPSALAFVGKIVLEVLPAALASLIGGVLFAHYQLGQSAAPQPPAQVSSPASAEMVQLIGQEHAMLRDFLKAQQAAENRQFASVNNDSTPVLMAAKMAEAAKRRASSEAPAAKPRAPLHSKPVIVAAAIAAAPSLAPVIAQADRYQLDANQVLPPREVSSPVAAPAPSHSSIVAKTLAIPRRVVSVTLHAVGTIGSIPSWIGHRFGDRDGDAAAAPFSSAS